MNREISWSEEAREELRALRPFDRPRIRRAVEELRHHADVQTRNRKPLRAALGEIPEATWQLRIGDHRVLYAIAEAERTVRVLRVILKGSEITRQAVGSRGES